MSGLYSASYRAAFLAWPAGEDMFFAVSVLCGWLLFVSSVFALFVFLFLVVYLYF